MGSKNFAEGVDTLLQSISIAAIHHPYKGRACIEIHPDHSKEILYATTPRADVPSSHPKWFAARSLNIDSFDIEPNAWDCGYYLPQFQ